MSDVQTNFSFIVFNIKFADNQSRNVFTTSPVIAPILEYLP